MLGSEPGGFVMILDPRFAFFCLTAMKCPFCHQTQNRVIDSRLSKDSNMIRRRRECERCSRRFTTYERVEEMMPLVIKKDGRRETYDRLKIINGLKRACEKRPVSINTIEAITDRIERSLQERGEKEIASSVIGETLMRELHDTDPVAYVRFASVYRSFKDISEFMVELEELLKERKGTPASKVTELRQKRE
jgi:transcriptional repressor NrdR